MAYLGREIWLFLTEEGRKGALYSVSGRSPASRQREAIYYPEERRVAIEPLDKSQQADALRHYNAMKFNGDLLVVSNGSHTEDILNSPDRRPVALRRILNRWGPETDSLNTPRIAGMINNSLQYLAIITEFGGKSIRVKPRVGTAYSISTYSGEGTEPRPFYFNRMLDQRLLPNIKVDGKSPEDIAEIFVRKVTDPEFFVCCSAGLWYEDEDIWKIAILNKSS